MQAYIETLPSSRNDAIASGAYHYYTGKPCKNGHFSARNATNFNCLKCQHVYDERYKKKLPGGVRPWNVPYNKAHAVSVVHWAVVRGELIRQSCERCGVVETVQAHHEDYSKPLEVIWLCKIHHMIRHRELRKLGIKL